VTAPLRVGLVGAGRWATVHREALQRVGAALGGVVTERESSAARVRSEWGVPASTSLDELLASDVEAVIIASPNDLHARQARAALEAGKHVLVEKPLAITAEDARAVARASASRPDLVVAVGHEMRVFQLFARVKAVIEAGTIGAPRHLALSLWRRPHRGGAGGWKRDPARLGSTILEEPVHYLDLARWYLGEPQQCQAWASSRPGREGLWENLDVRLTFPSGAQALITRCIAAYGHTVDLRLVGASGVLVARWEGSQDLDPEPTVSLVVHDGAHTTRVAVPSATGHAHDLWRQTAGFARAVRQGTPPAADARDGAAAVEMCLAVERSLALAAPVPVLGTLG
jgi:myo-inositol 2-dehydrogenase / D-chiro-inositol 1-dehydrogenase